jgi:hypothetical protein
MDIISFIQQLLKEVQLLDFVKDIELQEEIFIVKGKVFLTDNSFLKIYYNSKTTVQSITWIKNQERLWSIDYDKYKGWHKHKLPQVDEHISCSQMSLSEILNEFTVIWNENNHP